MSDNSRLPAVSEKPASGPLALVPRSLEELERFATMLCRSKLVPREFQGDTASTMLVLMKALECGEGLASAFDTWYVTNGRLGTYADAKVARCLQRPACLYFQTIESTAERCTRETHRRGTPKPERYTYTREDAIQAGLWHLRPDGKPPIVPKRRYDRERRAWVKLADGPCDCNWCKRPKLMLRHRCDTELAGMVYPDYVRGQYDVDEIREMTGEEPPVEVAAREVVDVETGEVQEIVPPASKEEKTETPIVPDETVSAPVEAPAPGASSSRPDVSKMTPNERLRYLVIAKGKYNALAREAKAVEVEVEPIPKDASIETLREMYQALHESIEARKAERAEAEKTMRKEAFPTEDECDAPDMANLPF